MAYSDKVVDHYSNPRNVGQMDKSSDEVGTGLVGAPECGDVMRLQIRVNPETQVIEDAKFKTFGCGSAIASSSLATEWVKGKTIAEALTISNTDIVKELALPPVKIHCSVLAEDAIRAAIGDWKKKNHVSGRGGRGCGRGSLSSGSSFGPASDVRPDLLSSEWEQTCGYGYAPNRDFQVSPGTRACAEGPAWAGMTLLTAEGQQPRAKQAIEITKNALKRIRVAMAKEGISPSAGGLRVGITGGGCSGLSYNIRFDTQAPGAGPDVCRSGLDWRRRMIPRGGSRYRSLSIRRAFCIWRGWCWILRRR